MPPTIRKMNYLKKIAKDKKHLKWTLILAIPISLITTSSFLGGLHWAVAYWFFWPMIKKWWRSGEL